MTVRTLRWTSRYAARILLPAVLAGAMSAGADAPPFAALDGAVAIKSQEAVTYVPIVSVTSVVPWAKSPIRVDGDLAEWKAVPPAVVMAGDKHASWFKGAYGGPRDLSAALRLARDDQHFYLALEIEDDRLPAPGRVNLAIVPHHNPLIVGWQDVGMRVKPDDLGLAFTLGKDGEVGMRFSHLQQRMDYSIVQNSFGSDVERRAFLDEIGAGEQTGFGAKIFSKMTRQTDGEKTVTRFEAAIPWKNLMPYDPVSFDPLKFNIAVEDEDGEGKTMNSGVVGWMPGLVGGAYSAAHFVNLAFAKPEGRATVDAHAQLLAFRFLDAAIAPVFSFHNHGEATSGTLELFDRDAMVKPLASTNVTLPPGFSKQTLWVHSEAVGKTNAAFVGRLTPAGRPAIRIPVHTPRYDDTVVIQPLAEITAAIDRLNRNIATLSNLYDRIVAKKLDTTYPLAALTLQRMFVDRCRHDMSVGDAPRVLRNTDYLHEMFLLDQAYMESVLRDPAAQLTVPPRVTASGLTMKDGYWWSDGKPVFLWGPCFFWYLRDQQPLVGKLGFNSIAVDIGRNAENPEIAAYMRAWKEMGVSINAHMLVPDLQLTGADVRASKLLKEHPDVKNLDQNNFLPFLIQHPVAREKIKEGFAESVAFWRHFPDLVRSYWLWNEPWYLNYSERTRQDFIAQYLKPRYKTIDALNKRWKSAYTTFEEIPLIQWPDPDNYPPWYDFQQFRDELLADFFGFLHKTAKALDPTKPTHTKFMAPSLHSWNTEKLQSFYDIAGHDGGSSDRDIPFLDFCTSLYPDKPLVNTEIHIHYANRKVVDLYTWRLALHGLADGNWWCWHSNQRFSDSLGKAESMYALTYSGLDVQRLMHPHIFALNKKPRQVATLFPDVVERRSDLSMVRLRMEMGPAQYHLGVHPFYVTEARAAKGELARHKLLLAGESDFVKDDTYFAVVDYVKNGGTAIVVRGGFAHNEYGDPRDTGELIKLEGGEPFGDDARVYPLGKGRVICMDTVVNRIEPVKDGGQGMRGGAGADNIEPQRAYQRVLARALAEAGLVDAVRLAPVDGLVQGFDWRVVEVDGGYTLCALPYGANPPFNVKLETDRSVKRIVNLITGKTVEPAAFELANGPNLFRIELR